MITKPLLAMLYAAALASPACGAYEDLAEESSNLSTSSATPTIGGVAPDFSLRDTKRRKHTLSQHQGKLVLLNFWATWCVPCRSLMPHLETLSQEFETDDFVVLGISTDEESVAWHVKELTRQAEISYPVLLDQQQTVLSQYNNAKTLPFTVLVDREGHVASIFSGYNPGNEELIRDEIEKLLPAPSTGSNDP